MDLPPWLEKLGMPGFMIAAFVYLAVKLGTLMINAWERTQQDRTKVEDKKADAMTAALTSVSGALASLSAKIDSHHTLDIRSHAELSADIASIDSKLDTVLGLTPVHGVPQAVDEDETDPESPHALESHSAPRRPATAGGTYHVTAGKRRS